MKPSLWLGVAGVALAGFVGYNAIYVPQQRQLRVIRTRIAEEQALHQTRADLEALLEELGQYRRRLPDEPDPSWLVQEVVSAAQRTGIPLTSLAQLPSQTSEQFTRLAVSLKTAATYHELGAFVDELERSPRFIRIDHVRLSPATRNGEAPSIELSLSTAFVPAIALSAAAGGAS